MFPKNFLLLLGSLSTCLLATACKNDPNFTIPYEGVAHDCKKIRFKEVKRESLCTDPAVVAACPQTCGVCCEDDPDYTFGLAWDNNIMQDCEWILKGKPDADEKRKKRYCTKDNDDGKLYTWGGRSVRDACPLSCDFCFDPVGATPSSSPTKDPTKAPVKAPSTIPSSSPSKSPVITQDTTPSAAPSRPPSPMPSPFPTLRPTSMPSMGPSDQPSVHPSDQPSMVPSVFPSDQPSLTPSASPSDQPSVFPSDSPSDQPSMFPSDQPSVFPSASPSDQPSIFPSSQPSSGPSETPSEVPSISPSDQPTGNPTASIKPSTVPTAKPSGETVAPTKSPTKAPTKTPTKTPTKAPTKTPTKAPTKAPTSACADTAETFELDNGNTQDCSWFDKQPSKKAGRINKYCPRHDVKTKCKSTCSFCVCADDPTFQFKLKNGNTQDCAWLTDNSLKMENRINNYCPDEYVDIDQGVAKGSIADMCTKSCGNCA